MKFFADVHCYHMINPIVSGEPLNLHPVAPPRGGSAVATITDCKERQNKRCSNTSRSALDCPLVMSHGKFIDLFIRCYSKSWHASIVNRRTVHVEIIEPSYQQVCRFKIMNPVQSFLDKMKCLLSLNVFASRKPMKKGKLNRPIDHHFK